MTKIHAMEDRQQRSAADLEEEYGNYMKRLKTETKVEDKLLKLKRFPVPLHIKKAMMDAVVAGNKVHVVTKYNCGTNCSEKCKDSMSRLDLWKGSLKNVEGMYGTGVLSFFSFLRSLLVLNVMITVVILVFLNIPQAINSTSTAESLMLTAVNSTSTNAYTCSKVYETNITNYVASETTVAKIQDFISGTGWMERTLLFYGYYFATNVTVSGIDYNFPLAYILVIGIAFFLSLIILLIQSGRTFRESVIEQKSNVRERYSNFVLSSWDYSLHDEKNASLKLKMTYNEILSELEDERHKERHEGMSNGRKCALYTIRALVNILILGLLGGGAYLIYYVQTVSAEYTSSNTSSGSVLRVLMEYLPSITISLLSAVLPIIFKLLIKAEDYNSETVVLLTLIRIVFVKLFSLVMLVVTVYILVTCSTKNSCYVGYGSCRTIFCWETYLGQQFYKLLITQFLVTVLVFLLLETPRALIVKKCSCKLATMIGLPEFDIPKNVLDLIYIQIIVWFGSLFCPFLPLMAIVLLVILFYCKLGSCYYNYQPSEIPYKASRSRSFFLVLLAITYLLCIIPIGYCVVAMTTSKSCGPFRAQNHMYDIVPTTIEGWPEGVRRLFQWIGSAAFIGLLVMILLIIIHYHATMASTLRALNGRLEDQITQETHEKHILYRKLLDAGISPNAEKRKKKKTFTEVTNETEKETELTSGRSNKGSNYQHDGWE